MGSTDVLLKIIFNIAMLL